MLDRYKRPWVISIAVSAAAHAALLAWVVLDVPTGEPEGEVLSRSAPLSAEDRPEEPAVQVVQIRPPGMMVSGGSASGGTAGGGGESGGATRIDAPRAAPQSPRGSLTLSPAQPMPLALEAPVAPSPAIQVADLPAAHQPATRTTRPNRGLIVRGGSNGEGATGRAGTGSTGRGGLGLGGNGVASIGTGEDCITVGTVTPEGRLPIGLDDIGRGIGGRSGRPSSFSGGRFGGRLGGGR